MGQVPLQWPITNHEGTTLEPNFFRGCSIPAAAGRGLARLRTCLQIGVSLLQANSTRRLTDTVLAIKLTMAPHARLAGFGPLLRFLTCFGVMGR